MSDWITSMQHRLDGWATALLILLVGALAGWLARSVLFRRLRALAARTRTEADEILLEATRPFWLPAALFLALHAAVRFAPVPDDIGRTVTHVASFLLVSTLTLGCTRFVGRWFAQSETPAGGAPAAPSLIAKAARVTVLAVGLMWAMQSAGLPIAPLLTALGVGSLALGLALQPTLSNFFAGMHLSMSKPIRIGDFIELEDGTQGEVVDISWRTTQLRQLANNLVIVPNARISDMRLLNYSLPEFPQSVVIPMGVAYDSDLQRVEEICIEVALGVIGDHPDIADASFDPVVRFHSFGDSSIDFNVVLRARLMTDRYVLVHEFVKRIKASFDRESIEIPFPQRVVHHAGESAPGPDEA